MKKLVFSLVLLLAVSSFAYASEINTFKSYGFGAKDRPGGVFRTVKGVMVIARTEEDCKKLEGEPSAEFKEGSLFLETKIGRIKSDGGTN